MYIVIRNETSGHRKLFLELHFFVILLDLKDVAYLMVPA